MRPTSLIVSLIVLPSLTRAGDQFPEWFTPYPEVTSVDGASYTTPASPKVVVKHYETELRTASVDFFRARASAKGRRFARQPTRISCVVRISESDPGLRQTGAMVSGGLRRSDNCAKSADIGGGS